MEITYSEKKDLIGKKKVKVNAKQDSTKIKKSISTLNLGYLGIYFYLI